MSMLCQCGHSRKEHDENGVCQTFPGDSKFIWFICDCTRFAEAPDPLPSHSPRWRAGDNGSPRSIYRDERWAGMADTPEIAAEIVARMNEKGTT